MCFAGCTRKPPGVSVDKMDLYVESLERLIAAAKEWPASARDSQWETFAGSPTRSSAAPKLGPIIGPVWAEPVQLAVTPIARRDPRRARCF